MTILVRSLAHHVVSWTCQEWFLNIKLGESPDHCWIWPTPSPKENSGFIVEAFMASVLTYDSELGSSEVDLTDKISFPFLLNYMIVTCIHRPIPPPSLVYFPPLLSPKPSNPSSLWHKLNVVINKHSGILWICQKRLNNSICFFIYGTAERLAEWRQSEGEGQIQHDLELKDT